MIKTPVVFLIFNREDKTKRVFEAIRQVRPSTLLVVADGPRITRPDEAEKCVAVRSIIDKVDWNCKVLTNYSDANLGCKKRISSGLDWVFSQVEEAIILEDDCLPSSSFFSYCEELLTRYRHDERIFSISGLNVQFARRPDSYSYHYSCHSHVWGWATWKRAWQHYDVAMRVWPEVRDNNLLENILPTAKAVKYWTDIFQGTYDNQIDTWDYQWILTCFIQHGLSIIPSTNLVSNIGFGDGATHTVNKFSPYANLSVGVMHFPLKHPPFVIRDLSADNFTQNTYYDCDMSILAKMRRRLKQFLKVAIH
jgi:hypothetical protein